MNLKPKLTLSEVDKAEMEISRVFGMVGGSLKKTFQEFWYKTNGLPCTKAELQAKADKLGNKAADGMTFHSIFQTALYQISPYHPVDNPDGWKPLVPTHEFTKNPDGTITIGEPAVGQLNVVV